WSRWPPSGGTRRSRSAAPAPARAPARSRRNRRAGARPSRRSRRRTARATRCAPRSPGETARPTGGYTRRRPTARGRPKALAPPPSSTHLEGLAVDRDPLGAHLIGRGGRWIAVGRDRLADRDHLRADAAARHARGRRQRDGPDLPLAADRDRGVRILELGG